MTFHWKLIFNTQNNSEYFETGIDNNENINLNYDFVETRKKETRDFNNPLGKGVGKDRVTPKMEIFTWNPASKIVSFPP